MKKPLDGNAIVYCEGAFNTPNGKTAHGLVRFTERYNVLGVIDSRYAGQDAGAVLDKRPNGILIYKDIKEILTQFKEKAPIKYFVIGLAPDGGRLPATAWSTLRIAVKAGLNIDSGLHDFINDNKEIRQLAKKEKVKIRDIRRTPARSQLHFFSGQIEEVDSLVIAVLGTDSAVGKRTTAWLLVQALRKSGIKSELIGTGQTAWMQGAKYSFVLDSLINDFVAGEIEHAIVSAWKDKTDVIVIEGQGSILNPAYPGGFEILAAGRPNVIILQHAPKRLEYDGFPGYPLDPLKKQIKVIELLSNKKVVAITLNHENMTDEEVPIYINDINKKIGIPVFDPLLHGGEELGKLVEEIFYELQESIIPN